MKAPRGFVTARIVTKKKRIWIHPLAVKAALLELLRPQQRVAEIDEQQQREHEAHDVFQAHGSDLLAGADVRQREQQEDQRDHDEHYVLHDELPPFTA